MKIYHNIRKLYTPQGISMVRGGKMSDVAEIDDAVIVVRHDGMIEYVGPETSMGSSAWKRQQRANSPEEPVRIDCGGLVALPGFIDSHTHAVFGGERSLEFTMRAEGRSYQQIAKLGGGIRASVEAVRAASLEEIVSHCKPFIERAVALGTTTMEVKSGYGLSTEHERKLLHAARQLALTTPMEIALTYLGAHAVPKDKSQTEYVNEIIQQQLPALQMEAEFCDVFMDEGYFTKKETVRICETAKKLGMKIKLHADELAETDGARTAVELRAYSADHLLRVSDDGIAALANSEHTVATLLPTTALSLRAPFAPARKMIEAGCAVAIATDCNPGSSMSENMQFVVTLAVIGMQMSPQEALTAATLNGAAALDCAATHGSLERNKVADFVLYDIPRLEYLPYHIAVSDVVSVIKRGEVVAGETLN